MYRGRRRKSFAVRRHRKVRRSLGTHRVRRSRSRRYSRRFL